MRYAVERKITSGNPDYWDYATMLELAEAWVAWRHAEGGYPRAPYQPLTTARPFVLPSPGCLSPFSWF